MQIQLRRFAETPADQGVDYAHKLHSLVRTNRGVLRSRMYGGTVIRYGRSQQAAVTSLRREVDRDTQANSTRGFTQFMAFDVEPKGLAVDSLVGLLTLSRGHALVRTRGAIAPILARGPLRETIDLGSNSTNVSGWLDRLGTSPGQASRDIAQLYTAGVASAMVGERLWTIEPAVDEAEFALYGIGLAGFRGDEDPRRHFVGEGRRHVQPASYYLEYDPQAVQTDMF